MNAPRYARLIADVFRRGEPRASELLPPAQSNRDEEIALIEQAIDRKRRQTVRWRRAAQWSAAAALVLGGLGGWRMYGDRTLSRHAVANTAEASAEAAPSVVVAIASGGGAIVATPGSSTPAVAGRALQAGSRLIVDPNAGATLSLSTGTHLEVEPGSQLAVVEDGRAQIFALSAGSMHADVAKLAEGERFIVRTLDAEVEVRGTSFLVDVVGSDPECGGGTTTRVTVYEGVVAVRSHGQEDSVRRGEHWPRSCRKTSSAPAPSASMASKKPVKAESSALAAPAPLPPAVNPTPHDSLSPLHASPSLPASPPLPASPIPPPPSTRLAEENNVFAEGMLARRYGNLPLAIAKMDRFLERYPTSHLVENAAAERMRLLRALDPAKAAGAARQYLQRYPAGYARGDAEAILAGSR